MWTPSLLTQLRTFDFRALVAAANLFGVEMRQGDLDCSEFTGIAGSLDL